MYTVLTPQITHIAPPGWLNFRFEFLQISDSSSGRTRRKWRLWEGLVEMFPQSQRPAFFLLLSGSPLSREKSFENCPRGWVACLSCVLPVYGISKHWCKHEWPRLWYVGGGGHFSFLCFFSRSEPLGAARPTVVPGSDL